MYFQGFMKSLFFQPQGIEKNDVPTVFLLVDIWRNYLLPYRRIQFVYLFILMLCTGLAELVSLGAVVPFLSVLNNPEQLWSQPLVKQYALSFGIDSPRQLLIPAAILFIGAAFLSALIRVLNLWLSGQLAARVGSDLSCDIYKKTLCQPYKVHLQRNSSEIVSAITTQLTMLIRAFQAILQLLVCVIISTSLIFGLFLIDWRVTLFSAFSFISIYTVLARSSRSALQKNSSKVVRLSSSQHKALQEGMGAIRDVLLDNSQNVFINNYRSSDVPLRRLAASNQFLSTYPRFLIEALGLTLIACMGCVLALSSPDGLSSTIVSLGSFALGAQRLLPAFQQIYNTWSVLKSCKQSIVSVLALLHQNITEKPKALNSNILSNSLEFKNVSFRYNSKLPLVLDQLNFVIRKGEHVGVIGSTGSGKSTTIDLLMGLLQPTSGNVMVDGVDIGTSKGITQLHSWYAAISHVPQNIYLADASIAENIAFGIPCDLIDMNRVKLAASQAQISSFIESTLEGYSAFVGEQGIRLSGGQRQRIGIARALYKRANVLILDEATSALDDITESRIIDSLNSLSSIMTIIQISHRFSTLQRCDRIIRLHKGAIVADGIPEIVLSD